MTKLKLLNDQIAVQVITETKSPSGIVLPGTVKKERPQEGIVRYVGEGKLKEDGKRIKMTVKVGDKIIFGGWAEITKVGNEEYYFISQDDVKAIILE